VKKNKVYVNKIDKKIGNNQDYCNIKEEKNSSYEIKNNGVQKNIIENNLTVREKINELLERNGYIFNVDVQIITSQKTYNTKIAGKVRDYLITLDNDIIHINDITDLIILN